MRNFKTLFLLFALTLLPVVSWAQFKTTKDGVWTDAIWGKNKKFGAYVTGDVVIANDVWSPEDEGDGGWNTDVTIKGDLYINEGASLSIERSSLNPRFVVEGSVYVNGDLNCTRGTLDIAGSLVVEGSMYCNGNINITNGTISGNISGTISTMEIKNASLSRAKLKVSNLYSRERVSVKSNSNVTCQGQLHLIGSSFLNIQTGCTFTVASASGVDAGIEGGRIQGKVRYGVEEGERFYVRSGGTSNPAYARFRAKTDGAIVVNYQASQPSTGSKHGVLFDQYWEIENQTTKDLDVLQLSMGCVPISQQEFASLYSLSGDSWNEISKECIKVNQVVPAESSASFALGLNSDLFGSGDGKINTLPVDVDYFEIESKYVSGEYTWTGESSDEWDDNHNWVGGVAPDGDCDVTISSDYSTSSSAVITVTNTSDNEEIVIIDGEGQMKQVTDFPVIYSNSYVNSITIYDGASLTVDMGRLEVAESINVFDANGNPSSKEGAVIVNNAYNASSSLRYASTNYNKFTINRTFLSGIAYYVGSATKEGNISLRSASQATVADDGKKYADEMETFNASTGKYVSASKFDSYYGAAVWTPYTPSEDERVLSQVGTTYNGKVTLSLLDKADTRVLLSNPYLVPIDLKAELTSEGAITIDRCVEPTFVFRSFDLNSGEYYYNCVNAQSGVCVASSSIKGSVAAKSAVIAPQQGFFAFTCVKDEYTSGKCNIVLDNTKFASEAYRAQAPLKDAEVEESDVLRLEVSNSDKNVDEVALVFRKGGSLEKNPVDSRKSLSDGMAPKDCNSIYVIKNDGLEASIPFLPETAEAAGNPIALGVNATTEASTLTISATNIDLFDEDYGVFLQDASANKSINLRLVPSYSFQAEAGEVIKDRFSILLVAPGTTAIANDPMESVNVAASADGLIVAVPAAAGASTVKVYDLAGRLVLSQSVAAGKSVVAAPAVKGVYVVEVVSSLGSKSIKINL